ncbi:glutamate--tRNA ligase [Methanolobus chelungpuianus]|uniref:Glutamate--tRNA ligase n=1 Tax=Methanolobus chelungpuianus TaxID=502115 RepID=A0AAE3HB54_9EURY|nr:glutamate--tRNA ligase [Methanolobus chelungpuianus]MCQ6962883.1 glutamyl-tRNA ligase [Methanolobus chelungpuianus]
MTLTEDDKKTVEKYALQNAVKYGQAPQIAAVMGRVMGECPHLRNKAKEVTPFIQEILGEVTKGSPEQWQARLEQIAPELIEELCTRKEPEKGLKPLEKAECGKVVMRFAPNPNGPPTLGSTRGIVVNSEYVKKYNGKLILRFDDTDTQTKRPMLEAYDWYREDCNWLGARPDEIIIASDRIPIYYEHARKLIEGGHAYVCFCESEAFKALKDAKEACPHRNTPAKENLEHWDKMLSGAYPEKSAVLRIKTDIRHKDPALRDFGAFRILRMPHPRPEVGDRYIVWPLLDFEGAIEDHVLGTTHIIRGKDLMDSEKRQTYIYKYLGWDYPITTHWGRVKMHEFGKFSTSGLRRAIEEGEYNGWDDPRLPTVRAIRRRGIQPEAVRKFMLDMGVGETDISISLDTLYAENRKLVEPKANRYFFVWDPVELEITGAEPCTANPPLHPTEDRGCREIDVGTKVLVCREDAGKFAAGSKVRLKDLYNVEITSMEPFQARYIDDTIGSAKKEKMKIIHWAPVNGVPVRVLSPDGEFTGIGEKQIAAELDKVVQFERFGFCRIDSAGSEIVAYYTHK